MSDEEKSSVRLAYECVLATYQQHGSEIKVFTGGALARLFGGHPIDTMASRVKTSPFSIYNPTKSMAENLQFLKNTIFQDSVNKNFFYRTLSLYQGIKPQSVNRVIQMLAMFMQRHTEKYLEEEKNMGKKEARFATALGFGGINAIIAAPFNQRKVSQQLKSQPVNFIHSIVPTIYRNTAWLLAKSTISAPIEKAFLQYGLFGSHAQMQSNARQKDIADFIACCFASGITLPIDRVKTMIQAGKLPPGTLRGIVDLIKKQGTFALWRGLPFEIALHSVGYALFYGVKNYLTEEEEKPSMTLRPA
ncbi:MAG TPA: MC/SLC25 family protein [Gammaproteobacteria bacterium]|jgi:hypothetical protein|nr:MC/SLC25 family protein [Gammaproteobacteria bacterium]